MTTKMILVAAILSVSGLAQAKTTLQCQKQVESAIAQWDNSVSVVGMTSKDGATYSVSYYDDGGDAEDQALLTVRVNPESCEVLKIESLSN